MTERALTAAMDNLDAWRLGAIAAAAGHPERAGIGDHIDRGLLLLRLLDEAGYEVVPRHPSVLGLRIVVDPTLPAATIIAIDAGRPMATLVRIP